MRTKFKAFLLLRCSFECLLQTSKVFPPFDPLLPANLAPSLVTSSRAQRSPGWMWALARPFREIPDRLEYSVCVYLSQQFRLSPQRLLPDLFWRGGASLMSRERRQARCRNKTGADSALMKFQSFNTVFNTARKLAVCSLLPPCR